jgi:hypothetical protein
MDLYVFCRKMLEFAKALNMNLAIDNDGHDIVATPGMKNPEQVWEEYRERCRRTPPVPKAITIEEELIRMQQELAAMRAREITLRKYVNLNESRIKALEETINKDGALGAVWKHQ